MIPRSLPALAAGILLLAPTALAHGYEASGFALRGTDLLRVFIGRAAELPNGTAPYGLALYDVHLNLLEEHLFWVVDNFLSDDQIPGPTYVNTEFAAEGATPGVDFELRGAQANVRVYAQGHFQGYSIVVASGLIV